MPELFTNNAASSLASGEAAIATTFTVQSGHGARFPNPGGGEFFRVTLFKKSTGEIEICRCTGRSGDILTVTRGEESTTPIAFNAGDIIELRPTAGFFSDLLLSVSDLGNIEVSSDLTVNSSHHLKNLIVTNTGVTITLPSVATMPDGFAFTIINNSTGSVAIARTGDIFTGDYIDAVNGDVTLDVQRASMTFVEDKAGLYAVRQGYIMLSSKILIGRTVAAILSQLGLSGALTQAIATTRGDMLYRNATEITRLAKGDQYRVLTMGANDPAWTVPKTNLTGSVKGGASAMPGATLHSSFSGNNSGQAIHSPLVESVCPCAGILRDFRFKFGSNTLSGDCTVTVMVNGVASDVSVTVPAGSTSVHSDTTNSISVSAGSRLSLRLVSASGSGDAGNDSWGALIV